MSKPIKILSDFDGVWTCVEAQAATINKLRSPLLAQALAMKEDEVTNDLAMLAEKLWQAPWLFGWQAENRLTAFADEDPFLFHNALMAAVDEHLPKWQLLKRTGKNGNQWGEELFIAGSAAFLRSGGKHEMLSAGVEVLQKLSAGEMAEKVELVFCSNFATEKIEHTLAEVGFKGRFRVRGNARKQTLSTKAEMKEWNGRQVAVDRPYYQEILREEKADWVIGDVFSLDLALPMAMGIKTLLVERKHTPQWSRSLTRSVQSMSEILPIILSETSH